MKKILTIITCFFAAVAFAGLAQAGPGSVEVQTLGDITIKMGAQVRLVPTSEVHRDFGISDKLNGDQEERASKIMRGAYLSTRAHLTEAGGAVKDNYIRGENRLFFNFAHDQDWDVYFALESDTTLDRASVDRTDFASGKQSQQFGIERLNASFNLPWINSRLNGGWDVKAADVKFGGMVYGDDDPGIGITGCANNFSWSAWYIKKDESEAGYTPNNTDTASGVDKNDTNAINTPVQDYDHDRTFMLGKLGYTFGGSFVEGFYMWDHNDLETNGDATYVDRHFFGINYKGDYGIFKPLAEIAYVTGDVDNIGAKLDKNDADISSVALYADLLVDLHEYVGLKKFNAHLGGYYLQGDGDPSDDKLRGFTPAVGITRFTPRYGSEQSIVHDGNPIFGQVLYSMFPAYYGTVYGGGINGGAALNNPGFEMIGGGVDAQIGEFTYITHVMAMWFQQSKAVEYYFTQAGVAGDVDIDSFMGVEWNHELRYKIYKNVTLKGGMAFLFPGSGAKDITQAYNAYGENVNFEDADDSSKVSMRFAAELLWFF